MNIASLDPEMLSLDLIGDDERGYDLLTDENIIRLKHLTPEHQVLSVYLDIRPETLKDQPVMVRYRHGVEAIRQASEQDWSHEQRVLFDAMTADVGERIEKMMEHPRGKGIALFASPTRVLPKKAKVDYQTFLRFSLPEGPADVVEWGDAPVLAPLLVLRDEHPETGIVLFDREKARFFLYYMGEAAEYTLNLINPEQMPLTKSHVWHGYGEHNHHQWQEEHYKRYLRHAAVAVTKVADKAGWKWLVLASPDLQESKHLLEYLPPVWRDRVIGEASLPLAANLNEVRDAAQPLVSDAEKREEAEVVAAWESEMNKPDGRAVAGIADTVLAAMEYRIQTLIAEEGFTHAGWSCDSCGGVVADLAEQPPTACPYCGANAFTEHPDIVGEIAVRVIATGGSAEIVHDPANREKAHELGMVGGLLRY